MCVSKFREKGCECKNIGNHCYKGKRKNTYIILFLYRKQKE